MQESHASQPDVLAITALIPGTVPEPIVIYEKASALRMAVVDRAGVPRLTPDEWDLPGVYVLLDLPERSGAYGCYVGQAVSGLRSRLLSHVQGKDHWSRALLVAKDTKFGFDSAEVGWLEGRLHGLLDSAKSAWLHNHDRPRDETLPPYARQALETCITSISRVLILLGYNPESPGDDEEVSSATGKAYQGKAYYGITVLDLVKAGLIAVGAPLSSTNNAYPASATVISDGSIETGGASYQTPSAAAGAAKNGVANGWDFWAVDLDGKKIPLADLRRELIAQRSADSVAD